MNTAFTAYSLLTGQILYSGSASDPLSLLSVEVGIHVGAAFVNGWLEGGEYYSKPEQPSDNHIFDWAAKQWVDPRTLQDLKDAKWFGIKQARSAAEYNGFVWDGSTFDSDAISQARIQGAVQLAGMAQDFSIDWTLADNTARSLSAADMIAVGAALGLHVATQFTKARVLREQIEASSAEELTLLHW